MDIRDFQIKLSALPEDVRSFFLTDNPMLEMKKSFAAYGVNSALSEHITTDVAQLYISEIGLEQLPAIISQKVQVAPPVAYGIAFEMDRRLFLPFKDYFKTAEPLMNQWQTQKGSPIITDEIQINEKVLNDEPWIHEMLEEKKRREAEEGQETTRIGSYPASLEKLSLKDAAQKYPETGQQLIGSEPLKLLNQKNSAAPSVKNWISDYTFRLGFDRHDSMARGNYVFQGENAKKLTDSDRQKLSILLRSYDDGTLLTINPASKEIIFAGFTPPPAPIKPANIIPEIIPQPKPSIIKEVREIAAPPKPPTPVMPAQPQKPATGSVVFSPIKTNSSPFFTAPKINSDPKIKPSLTVRTGRPSDFANRHVDFFNRPSASAAPVQEKTAAPGAPGKGSGISFSSPQKLPNEQPPKEIPPAPKLSPYRIVPFSKANQTPVSNQIAGKNVVDLKNIQ